MMYTVSDNVKYELVIKNSRFITIINKIGNLDDVNNVLNAIKLEYPGATHYCYAYIILDNKKANDDGEPSGTAGIPILKVLESNNLTNILVVVIRYFGGIKLGANGLIRAYTKCTSNAIKETTLKELIKGYNISLTFNYERQKEIDYLLRDTKINNKQYDNLITYNINIDNSLLDYLKNNNFDYQIIGEILIEKEKLNK